MKGSGGAARSRTWKTMRNFEHGIRITVCRNCQDREVGCHATCEKYIQQRAEQLQKKKDADPARKLAMDLIDIELTRANKKKKYYKRRDRR